MYMFFKNNIYFLKNKSKYPLSIKTYNELSQYGTGARELRTVAFNSKAIEFTSPFWFLHSVDEIFVQEVYKFLSSNPAPYIIDCGANIGLSVLYFKKMFPDAKIVAFEADPLIFGSLKRNVSQYGYSDVTLVNAAVWTEETTLTFHSEGSVGGKLELGNKAENPVEVPAIRLMEYLKATPVDFLKIDIEGAEYDVLKDCVGSLQNIKNLFIEYHVMPDEPQHLHEMLQWISTAGFKYYIKEAWNNMDHPFMKTFKHYYQMQLNIFCYRP